jgi:hypothetical protein
MSDPDDEDQESPGVPLEDDAIAAGPEAIEIVDVPLDPFEGVPERLRILGQDEELLLDDPLMGPVDPRKIVEGPAEETKLESFGS